MRCPSHVRPALFAVLLLSAGGAASAQQDELSVPVQPPPAVAPDALTQARAAAARGDQAEALSRYLRVLAATPDNVPALIGAGRAALGVGDMNAAAGFLSRADALEPRNGQVKAGLAVTMLQRGDARAALRLFKEATDLGVAVPEIAADRGLAYDLRGDPRHAQADYTLALRDKPSDETTRRLAISQGIGGDLTAALATLDPLLRKQDVPAWRARTFLYALTGNVAEAQAAAALVMPSDQVAALAPYLARLATLKPGDRAAAIHLGRFPGEGGSPSQTAAATPTAPRLQIDRTVLAPAPVPSVPAQLAQALPPSPAATPAPIAAQVAIPAPEQTPLSGTTQVPTAPARTPVPARAAMVQPDPAPPRVDPRARRAAAAAAAKEKQQRAEEAEERAAAKRNPARHWVQVAGGANKRDLGKEWSKLKSKWPSQLAGRSPWTIHYRHTNRLMIGPFASSDAAQDWVSDRKKEGFATFRVETDTGEQVERVD